MINGVGLEASERGRDGQARHSGEQTLAGRGMTVGRRQAIIEIHRRGWARRIDPALLALIVRLLTPALVGLPLMTPVLLFSVSPAGSPVTAKLVGLFVAVMV
jgi:hypothetical protein